MQGDTENKSMAVLCAEQLRAKGFFAEVVSHNESKFFAKHEVWIKDPEGRSFQADLDAAFEGRAVEFKEG